MVSQRLRLALLIGAITAVAVSPASANFRAPRCCDPCGSSPAGATAPAFRTVTCTEWVKENVAVKRVVNRVECRTETYDTVRCERVCVVKDRVVSVTKKVPVWTEQTRKVCCKTTVWEDRVVNKTSYKTVQETCTKKQLVRLGHWECKEVTPLFSGLGSGGGLFSGHGSCGCDSGCGATNACNACRPTRTRKVWVSCPEYRECPVTVCKKVCVNEAVTCKVAVCKNTWKEEKVKVCTYTCVQENVVQKCTTYETRQVPCKATRTVRVCVPHEETVNCCKWVQKTVSRQVPVCNTPCTTSCGSSTACCDRPSLFGGLRDRLRHNGDCCRPAPTCCK